MSRQTQKSKRLKPLKEFVEVYVSSRPGLDPKSAAQYRYTLKSFEKFLGRPATLADLNEERITGYVSYLLQRWSQSTSKRNRNSLVVWWRFAARRKLLAPPPFEGVPTVKVTRRNATAWTLDQVEKLLVACQSLSGRMRLKTDPRRWNRHGVHLWTGPLRAKWWSSLILFLYDTGARIGAAMAVAPADLDPERGFVVLQGAAAKTGLEQVLRFSRQTVEAIREIYDPTTEHVWQFFRPRARLFSELGLILEKAGLPNDRTSKFHRIRKTCATLTAAAGRFDLAQTTLGHSTGYMTRHYVDQRAAPSQSAADVLPRPQFGENIARADPRQQSSAPARKPNGESFETALSMIAGLPLSAEEKAGAVRRLLGEQKE